MTPVVVCGGGPVGLTLALELAAWDVEVTLIERHPAPSPFPKGRAISTRSMEIYRQLGLEDELTAEGMDRDRVLHFFSGETLDADAHVRISTGPPPGGSPFSPTYTLACPQDRLEAVLRRHVTAHPLIDARFGAVVTGAEITRTGATVEVAGPEGRAGSIAARWLVAADGADSSLRDAAGIERARFGGTCENVNILFEADLGAIVADRRSLIYTVSNDALHASVLTVDGERRWLCNVIAPDRPAAEAAGDHRWCRDRIIEALGRTVPVDVLDATAWDATASNAKTYRHDSLLLAGDAAHAATPYGGFGMNCGLGDVHNLAWKLATVLSDPSALDLIDTYDLERRPVGERTVIESANRLEIALEGHRSGRTRRGEASPNPSEGLVLGDTYRSSAVISDGPAPEPSVGTYRPSAAPGARAPHVRLPDGRSTLDLFGPHHTLLHHPDFGPELPEAVRAELRPLRTTSVPLTAPAARAAYDIDGGGAVLVRPDGHIAWRT